MKVESDKIAKGQKVYAVVLTDTDGNTYGLHHVTEIWRATELGFEADSALAGKTISAVTYYTDDGVIKLKLEKNQYIPHIARAANAEVAKSDAGAKETTLTLSGFPKDFEPEVKVPKGMSHADGKINFGSALPGSYTVTVSDAKGKYADVTASFTVSTSKAAAKYDASSVALKKADSAEDADFTNFLKNITSVKVGDTNYAATGKNAVTIIKKDGAIDEDAKPNNEALFADGKEKMLTVSAAGYPDLKFSYTPTYTYAYAAVPYDEYWQSEGVYLNKGSKWDVGSNELDGHNEYDKGAFDAVSRATTNHGLHRGSFQQSVVIHTANKDYYPVAWTDGDNFVDADGKTYNKKEIGITSYNITGIKYVPVKVKSDNFAEFCKSYTVTQNGETLQGGFSENNLNAYTAVAAVDKDTNGLKEVTLGLNGYTFGARKTGSGSGIKGAELKKADEAITAAPKKYSGNYGEMLRVDLNNNYGDLGGHMQTVVWKYYGDGDTVLATYGTKFAADNWMHRIMGIQLGLTDSLRAKLPDGKDGTGKWTITVYALGYSDTTYEVNVTADNLPKKVEPMTKDQKEKLTELANKAKTYLDNGSTKYPSDVTKEVLQKHYNEANSLINAADTTEAAAAELITELSGYLEKMDAANTPSEPGQPTTETKTATLAIIQNQETAGSSKKYRGEDYNITVTVTLSDGKITDVSATSTAQDDDIDYFGRLTATFYNAFKNITATKTDDVDKVDAVSGATYSSATVKQAIKNALSK